MCPPGTEYDIGPPLMKHVRALARVKVEREVHVDEDG